MELKANVTMRYCQPIDRFIKIRAFSDTEIHQLFKNVSLTDRRSYRQLVINTTIVNYNDDILKDILLSRQLNGKGVDTVEEEFYQMCIKVNPALDINKIAISMEEGEPKDNLFLLERMEKKEHGAEVVASLERELQARIVGQDEAIAKVVQALKRTYAGIMPPHRPAGVFLFAGQTGVGKTELAKALSELLLGDKERLVRIDCSEYALPHEYAKLIGAPPGYVGYDDGGVLSGPMLQNAERVVLFDEIEKAHAKVHNLLLQIMDEGMLTDNKGQKISFTKSIVIMTSNIGAGEIAELEGAIGFGNRKGEINHGLRERETVRALEHIFAPEFLNRIDDVIVFRNLDHGDNVRIVEMFLDRVRERLSGVGKRIVFPAPVREYLAEKIESSRYGARPLKRIINKYIEAPLSDCLLTGRFRETEKIKVSLRKGKIHFHPA